MGRVWLGENGSDLRELLHELWPWAAMLPPDTVVYPNVDTVTAGATLAELRSRLGSAVRPCGMCWPASVCADRWGRCTCGQPIELHGLIGIAWLLERLWALLPPLAIVRSVNRALGPCDRPRAIGRVVGFDGGPAVCRCGHRFDAHAIEDLRRALANAVVAVVARDGALDDGVLVGLTYLLDDIVCKEPSLANGAESAQFAHAEHCAIPGRAWRQFSTCRPIDGEMTIAFSPWVRGPDGAIDVATLQVGKRPALHPSEMDWTAEGELRVPRGPVGERIWLLLENRTDADVTLHIAATTSKTRQYNDVPCNTPLSGKHSSMSCVRCGVALRNHDPLDLVEALTHALARVHGLPHEVRAELANIAEDAQLDVMAPRNEHGDPTGFTLPAGVNLAHVVEQLNIPVFQGEPENLLVDRLVGAAKLLLQQAPDAADTVEAWLINTHRLLVQARVALDGGLELVPDGEWVALLSMELSLAYNDLIHVGHATEARLVCLRTQIARLHLSPYDRDSTRLPEFEGHSQLAEIPVSLAPEDDAHTTHLRSPPEAHPSGGETLRELGPDDEATVDDDSWGFELEVEGVA